MTDEINSVFSATPELEVMSDSKGNVVMLQDGEHITFPVELALRVITAITEASRGDR